MQYMNLERVSCCKIGDEECYSRGHLEQCGDTSDCKKWTPEILHRVQGVYVASISESK